MSTSDYNLLIFACLIVPPLTLALAGVIDLCRYDRGDR
jgi:hypothetical protein